MKKIHIAAMAILAVMSTGCAQLEQVGQALAEANRRSNVQRFQQQEDKQLASAFYSLDEKGEEVLKPELAKAGYFFGKRSNWAVTINRKIANEANIGFAIASAERASVDIMDDVATPLYIAAAQARGNKVVLYKPRMASAINGIFVSHHTLNPDRNTQEWFGFTGALIEYGKDGQIVSAMTKSRQSIITIGASVYEYAHIRYGREAARMIENKLPNSLFSETLLREIRNPSQSAMR